MLVWNTKSEYTSEHALDDAFARARRELFLPRLKKSMADYDGPLEIGHGQTNSQPFTVRNMLRWLDLKPGQRVLDVGSGSGWTSALLSTLVGSEGQVYAVERIDEIRQFGEKNCQRFGCRNVSFFSAGQALGLQGYAPFDRILVSAAARGSIPRELVEQLASDGKLVIPVDSAIYELKKTEQSGSKEEIIIDHYGYSFVPLVYQAL